MNHAPEMIPTSRDVPRRARVSAMPLPSDDATDGDGCRGGGAGGSDVIRDLKARNDGVSSVSVPSVAGGSWFLRSWMPAIRSCVSG
jgi:hypothetical protein